MRVSKICRNFASLRHNRARSRVAALAVLLLLVRIPTASAVPLISIDLDTVTPGIQDSLSVAPGANFSIDLVITGDGSPFDTVIFEVGFSDAGTVLGLVGGPTAGSLAAMAPILALDAFGPIPAVPGGPLTAFPSGSASGEIGLVSAALPFNLLLPTADIFRLTLNAVAVGSSVLSPSAGALGGGLGFAGGSVPFTTASATVTVTDPNGSTIPEPSLPMLLGAALVGLGLSGRNMSARLFPNKTGI